MKTNMSKGALIAFAIFLSAFSLTMVSINPVSGQMAGVLLFVNSKANQTPDLKASTVSLAEISGRYPIGVTISEDFLKKGSEKITQELFVNGKRYSVVGNGITTDLKAGYYDVKGSLNTKTGVVTLSSAKFAGETFDGVKDATGVQTTAVSKKSKKVAVFLLDSQESASQPFYPANINDMMFGSGKFKQYFNEASYGRQPITGDVFGWFTMPGAGSCVPDPTNDLGPLISGTPINLNNYTNIVIISLCTGNVAYGFSNTAPQPWLINGTVYNKTVSWVSISENKWNQTADLMGESANGPHIMTNLEFLLTHEFGHALGLNHAHGISCEGTLPTENCQGIGLGNFFDVMAYNTLGLHFSAWEKAKLGWFNAGELGTITQSGTYNIRNLEAQPSNTGVLTALSNTPKAYKIKPSANSNATPIWIEFRKAIGFDAGINTPAGGGVLLGQNGLPPYNFGENQNGILVYKEGFEGNWSNQINDKSARVMYLRGAPNLNNENSYQVSLNQGETYTDPRYGLTITTLSPLNQNTRRFQVTMNPNLACTALAPYVGTWTQTPPTTANPGSTWTVTLRIVNKDYISCPSSNFTATLGNVPTGITQANFNSTNVTQFLSNLAPDDERIRSLNVSIASSIAPGQYNIPIIITNSTSGLSTTTTFPLTVQ